MTIRHLIATFGVFAAAGLTAPAQDPPEPPSKITIDAIAAAAAAARGASVANVVPGTFRAQLVVDNRFKAPVKNADGVESRDPRNRTGKIHCLVCENGLAPTVAIFVRADIKGADATSGVGKLIKATDTLIPKYRSDKLSAFAMFLKLEGGSKLVKVKTPDGGEKEEAVDKEYPDDEKRDAHAQEVSTLFAALNTDNVPFGLAPTESKSIKDFAISDATPVTVIIYNRLRMAQRWDLKPDEITDAKIGEILTATEEMIGVQKKK